MDKIEWNESVTLRVSVGS